MATITSIIGTLIWGSSSRGNNQTAAKPSNTDVTMIKGVSFESMKACAIRPARPREGLADGTVLVFTSRSTQSRRTLPGIAEERKTRKKTGKLENRRGIAVLFSCLPFPFSKFSPGRQTGIAQIRKIPTAGHRPTCQLPMTTFGRRASHQLTYRRCAPGLHQPHLSSRRHYENDIHLPAPDHENGTRSEARSSPAPPPARTAQPANSATAESI